MKLIPEANDRQGEVRRSFVTSLDPVEAFAAANALLGPRGFTLGEGNPGRFQRWNRGQPTDSNKAPLTTLPHSIRLEMDHGRIAVTATMQAGPRQAQANTLLSAYAESLEALLARKQPLEQAIQVAAMAENNLKRTRNQTRMKRGMLVGGGIAALIAAGVFLVMSNPSIKTAILGNSTAQKSKSKNHTPPVVTVRRAGEPPRQSNAPE